jgi:hypothetical protein
MVQQLGAIPAAAVVLATLSIALVLASTIIQQANAQSTNFKFEQKQNNKCSAATGNTVCLSVRLIAIKP